MTQRLDRIYRYAAGLTVPAHFMASRLEVAAAFVMLLGDGLHTAETVDDPRLIVAANTSGGFEGYWREHFGIDNMFPWIRDHQTEIVRAAKTFHFGPLSTYRQMLSQLEAAPSDDARAIIRRVHLQIHAADACDRGRELLLRAQALELP